MALAASSVMAVGRGSSSALDVRYPLVRVAISASPTAWVVRQTSPFNRSNPEEGFLVWGQA